MLLVNITLQRLKWMQSLEWRAQGLQEHQYDVVITDGDWALCMPKEEFITPAWHRVLNAVLGEGRWNALSEPTLTPEYLP